MLEIASFVQGLLQAFYWARVPYTIAKFLHLAIFNLVFFSTLRVPLSLALVVGIFDKMVMRFSKLWESYLIKHWKLDRAWERGLHWVVVAFVALAAAEEPPKFPSKLTHSKCMRL